MAVAVSDMPGGTDYAPDLWHDFAVTVGGLAGALTGLLFVALSAEAGPPVP